MSSNVQVRQLGQGDLDLFIRSPWELFVEHPSDRRSNAVPPLIVDERSLHDPESNPALHPCLVERWLAWRDGKVVGRVMGIVHQAWNEQAGERTARFFQLDTIRDAGVVRALLEAVECWARSQGMDRIIGPFGFSDKDPQGLQVEGFEHLPVVATPTNPDWLPGLVEACGYSPYEDLVSYRLGLEAVKARDLGPVAERAMRSLGLRRVEMRSKHALRTWILPVLRLVNMTYSELLGFVPMKRKEMEALANKYMFILDPELVELVVDRKGDPVAFVIAVPDMSEGLIKANGRLLPFGWFHILRAMRRSRQLDLLLGAVRPDMQGKGLTAILTRYLLATAGRRGFTHLDSHLVMERNTRMCAQMERLGAEVWKRYRVYAKEL